MHTRNKLVECPGPGILFTRDNAVWALRALALVKVQRNSLPEQDELFEELRDILFRWE